MSGVVEIVKPGHLPMFKDVLSAVETEIGQKLDSMNGSLERELLLRRRMFEPTKSEGKRHKNGRKSWAFLDKSRDAMSFLSETHFSIDY
jgi:hypothetical protein